MSGRPLAPGQSGRDPEKPRRGGHSTSFRSCLASSDRVFEGPEEVMLTVAKNRPLCQCRPLTDREVRSPPTELSPRVKPGLAAKVDFRAMSLSNPFVVERFGELKKALLGSQAGKIRGRGAYSTRNDVGSALDQRGPGAGPRGRVDEGQSLATSARRVILSHPEAASP